MEITAQQLKELRDQTGISVMQCKRALEEANGDMAQALEILKTKSAEIAAKKGDRDLGAGTVASYIHNNNQSGALVELSCETDFVAKNEEFVQLAKDIAMHVTAFIPESVDALLEQPFIMDGDITVATRLDQAVQKFGERTVVTRFERFAIGE
jgi:elongation factor Ts